MASNDPAKAADSGVAQLLALGSRGFVVHCFARWSKRSIMLSMSESSGPSACCTVSAWLFLQRRMSVTHP